MSMLYFSGQFLRTKPLFLQLKFIHHFISIHFFTNCMKINILSIVKYAFSFALAFGLFWYLYREQDVASMLERFSKVRFEWIFMGIILAVLSHFMRAWRWKIVLEPLGYQPSTGRSFLAVMVGYLANLAVPRMGEVSRCVVLRRTSDVPVNISFGTVITERVIDLCFLVVVVALVVFLEFDKLGVIIAEQFGNQADASAVTTKLILLFALFATGVISVVMLFIFKETLKKLPLYEKIRSFVIGLKDGLLSIGKIAPKSRYVFLFQSIMIWVLYYLTSYALFNAMEETAHLSALCALSVLAMTSISMAIPVQGGFGVYHVVIATTLVAYGLPENLGKDTAFLLHSTQTFAIVFVGAISLLISLLIKNNSHQKVQLKPIHEPH